MEEFYCQNDMVNPDAVPCKIQCSLCAKYQNNHKEPLEDWEDDYDL